MDKQTQEIEAALVGHWSHLGRWPSGALVDEGGVLRYETPIPHLPYNGVIRTAITAGDPDETISDVMESFQRREVPFLWWEHPSCTPDDLGSRLQHHGLIAVERVTGMSIELDAGRSRTSRDVRFVEVLDAGGMEAYEDLLVRYWELPRESQDMVASLNRFWGPGHLPAHRWVAYIDDQPVGKALLSLAAPEGVAAVYGMSVTPEARGRGIAGGLTTTLLERAKALGCHASSSTPRRSR